jgi:hypothetical protein
MSRGKVELGVIIGLFVVMLFSAPSIIPNNVVSAAPNSPYEGSGEVIDVHEFARNSSISFSGQNGTSFTYDSDWYPSGYRGYRLQTNISQLYRFTDPLPDGSFENTTGFDSTWILTNDSLSDPLIKSINPETGHNPTDGSYVMDVELPNKKIKTQTFATIDNDFSYTSEFFPDITKVSFDIKLEDISDKEWLVLRIAILNQGSEKGIWEYDLKALKAEIGEKQWSHQDLFTASVNGQIRLRITLTKQTSKPEDVKGHIYFDNFQYVIGSDISPSEAALTLNGESFIDSGIGASGRVDIYADPASREEILWANCWSTDQTYQFTSTEFHNLTFYYEYAMYMKQINTGAATTFFSAPVGVNPTWQTTYNVTVGAPSGYDGYCFGLYLQEGWVFLEVNNSLGQSIAHAYNSTTQFVKLDDGVANVGETYTVYASAINHIVAVYPQKASSPTGPWSNVSSGGYYVKDEYIRIVAQLQPIEPTNNYANISIFYPNGSLWKSAETPTDITVDDGSAKLTTTASWQIPAISDIDIGQPWLITVSFNNQTQCGMRQELFSVVVATRITKNTPIDGVRVIWGDSVRVNITAQNDETSEYITDGTARIRYIDRNLQVQYVSMVPNGMGAYWTDLSTNLMVPDTNAEFAVEFFKQGYLNNSYSEGTHALFLVNLVNDIITEMIKPSQITGPSEYTAETSSPQGYTIQVKFYDPYQTSYVLNGTSFWPNVKVRYDYYEDNGSGLLLVLSDQSFIQNSTNRLFSHHEPTFGVDIVQVKYEITMRVEDASWEFKQQNITVIINIVSWATNLDALQTTIEFPPSFGDGWAVFDPITDDYEVHVYWSEAFNITVFYENVSTHLGISFATVRVQIGASTYTLSENQPGHYTYILDTTTLSIGLSTIYINATFPAHAFQTIQIRLYVETRQTSLTNDQTGSVFEIVWGDDFDILFTYLDIVDTGNSLPLSGATVTVEGYIDLHSSIQDHLNGNYTITLQGDVTESTYIVRFNFALSNYRARSETFTIIVRPRHTQAAGFLDSVSVPWGENVIITLHLNDTDFTFIGISGATITFTWFDNILGTDYWFVDNGDGSYTITLNTTKVPVGTQGYTLLFQMNKTHYDSTQVTVIFQVRDIEAILYNLGTIEPYSTSVPWGDPLTIILQFNDTDHGNSLILDATVTCDWDFFFWSVTYNTTYHAYLLRIDTSSQPEGSYTIQITANLIHYRTGNNIQGFVIRTIQTSGTIIPSYIPAHPLGDNMTLIITYQDLDHGGIPILFATVAVDWNATYYTIYDFDNGTYAIELNTTCRVRGSHQILVTLSLPPHYAPITLPVTLILERTPLTVAILDPTGGQISVDYGESVLLTVNITDHHGNPVSDVITVFRWGGHSPVTMNYLGNGIYTFTFLANETPSSYVITIEATNDTQYQIGISTVLLFIQPTNTDLTVLTPLVTTVIGGTFTISVNFTTIDGSPIDGANVTYAWSNQTGILIQVAPGIYNATIDTTGFESGQYTLYVSASKPTMLEQFRILSVVLTVIPTALQTTVPVFNLYWGTPFTVLIYFNDTYNNLPIDGADVQYSWANQTGSLQPTGEQGWYNITLSSTLYTAGSFYTLTLTADFPGYQYAITTITVNILPQSTDLALVTAEAHYLPENIITPLNGTSWRIPWGDLLILYFNYTDNTGIPIANATGVYNWGYGSGTLEYHDGLYIAYIDLTGVTPNLYPLEVTLSRQNYETRYISTYEIDVTRIQVFVDVLDSPATISTGTPLIITIRLYDEFHGLLISNANVTALISRLSLTPFPLINNGDGTYTLSGIRLPTEEVYLIIFEATGHIRYEFISEEVTIVAQLHPIIRNSIQIGALIAVIGIILLAIWFAYARVFSVPWMVRKMRKMSKTIGKGDTPTLSKIELSRISSRSDQMSEIVNPYYGSIGLSAGAVVIPAEIDWKEIEAEEEAIWSELKSLPLLEYEQKLELFQQMKQIPPSERVWFLEDLRKQMKDGTRFARKPKKPELSEDLEQDLQRRLATFPALSQIEKQRIAAQLRKLPKEEWDEIFHTLAVSDKPPVVEEELLRPDEFPSLSKDERQRVLEEIRDLSPEERRKVLSTLREKKAKDVPKGKVVKGKKEFHVDDSTEGN